VRGVETKIAARAAGADDLPSVRAALAVLERERGDLERRVREAASRPVTDRDSLATELIACLANIRQVLEPASRRSAKPSTAWVKLVAVGGIEPPTRGL
jgi:hypothetical protein